VVLDVDVVFGGGGGIGWVHAATPAAVTTAPTTTDRVPTRLGAAIRLPPSYRPELTRASLIMDEPSLAASRI